MSESPINNEVRPGADRPPEGSPLSFAPCNVSAHRDTLLALQAHLRHQERLLLLMRGQRDQAADVAIDLYTVYLRAGWEPEQAKQQAVKAVRRDPGEIPGEPEPDAPSEALSVRERTILQVAAQGVPTREIAARLGISRHTVRTHIRNATSKLGVHSKLEAVVRLLREGDLPPAV